MTALPKLRLYCLAGVLMLAATRTCGANDDFAERIRASAEDARHGNFSPAMAELQFAVALQPDNPEGWYQLGLLLGQLADFRGAEAALRRALRLRPDFSQAHYNLGLTLIANPQSKLDWPGAIAEFREALKNNADFAEAHNLLGAGLTSEGEIEAAISELQQAVRLKPALAAAHFNLAIALEQNGQLDPAAKEYQDAVAAKGEYPEAATALGELFFRMGRASEAKLQLESALHGNPDLPDAYHALAGVLQSLGKPREAAVALNIAKDLSARTIDAMQSTELSNQGLAMAAKGDLPGANAALRKAILHKPDYGLPHFNLGLILADQGDLPGASMELTKAISLLPGRAKPWIEIARVFRQKGELQSALDAFSWAARLSPDDKTLPSEIATLRSANPALLFASAPSSQPAIGALSDTVEGHLVFAETLHTQTDYLGEIGELLRAIALQPDSAAPRRRLAGAYKKFTDLDRAVIEYYKVLYISPDDWDSRTILGRILLDRGDAQAAAEEFRIALIYNPDSLSIRAALRQAQVAAGNHR